MNASPLAALLAPAVEFALNQALAGSSAARHDLQQLDGKVVALELKELPLRLYFLPGETRITVLSDYHGAVDMSVRVPSAALLQAALRRDELPPKGIEISGDAETAQIFSRLLKQADLDWEELLSHRIGDVAAHRIGTLVRGALNWGRDAYARVSRDLTEYLQFEIGVLPQRHEVDMFLGEVDRLRDDVERLAARVSRAAGKSRPA
ncbi:MAG TPA: SCP2 sterol-binding domain-containing protein [Gammaproteobacteria bacterium]|nr:SCP2 sterol-binding domain-containing protein [Gammaproteobacteria bacterium]